MLNSVGPCVFVHFSRTACAVNQHPHVSFLVRLLAVLADPTFVHKVAAMTPTKSMLEAHCAHAEVGIGAAVAVDRHFGHRGKTCRDPQKSHSKVAAEPQRRSGSADYDSTKNNRAASVRGWAKGAA